MQVRVKLLGTLPSLYLSEYPEAGLQLELPDSTTVAELVAVLGMPPARVAIVTINGVLARAGDRIPENGLVKLMHGLVGG
jgi:sulfur carrier protein ThiS